MDRLSAAIVAQGAGLGFYDADALIVGGGPTGLAAAIALRQAGVDVLVADALEPPIDKACGEGLMPDSRRELASLGIDPDEALGAPFVGIRFADLDSEVSAEFAQGKGLGLRRLALHRLLLDRAETLGVRMQWGSTVKLRAGEAPSLNGSTLRYKYLIGADGEASRTRAWAGLNTGKVHSRRFGFRAHFEFSPEMMAHPGRSHVEVHWGEAGQVYVTPMGERKVCVAAVSRQHSPATFQRVIDSVPVLRDALLHAKQLTPQRGAVSTTSSFHRVAHKNIALVGDASGSVDAITGEGLAMGFRQALLLRDSIDEGSLERYQAQHADILRPPQRMANLLLWMDRYPSLRRRVLRAFASRPDLFAAMLRVHLSEETWSAVALRHGTEFGRLLLSSAG